jgi:hypothetical protein
MKMIIQESPGKDLQRSYLRKIIQSSQKIFPIKFILKNMDFFDASANQMV